MLSTKTFVDEGPNRVVPAHVGFKKGKILALSFPLLKRQTANRTIRVLGSCRCCDETSD